MKEKIRNFCIIAHIDHGKSTLADRILELAGVVDARKFRPQILDRMELERERGITIKAKAVRLSYHCDGDEYILNLIDTPGHVDFAYEVTKSLKAAEGAILLVDASQGVEAQTVANFYLALENDLKIIPVINKIDLPNADVERVVGQLEDIFGFKRDEISLVSAKEGKGVQEVLKRVIREIPPPEGDEHGKLKALLFDSSFDIYKGVALFIRVFDGKIKPNKQILMMHMGNTYRVEEIGVFSPEPVGKDELGCGEVGYVYCNIKNPEEIDIGDTITYIDDPVDEPLAGYKKIPPMVFCGIFPSNPSDYSLLREAIEKLRLSDSSFIYEPDNLGSLGYGFRCGFLGLLHMEIVQERLEREYGLDLILTSPNVRYLVKLKEGEVINVESPHQLPLIEKIEEIQEPFVKVNMVVPLENMDEVCQLCKSRRGEFVAMEYLGKDRLSIVFEMPLVEIIVDFYDRLKSATKGYASMDYEFIGFRETDVVKLDIMVNGKLLEAFSLLVHKEKAYYKARAIADKLKEVIPRQMYEVNIQVAIGSKVIASSRIPPLRKNVTAKCYGGDITRKRKLWEKQKKGKKKMKQFGKIQIPNEAFLEVLKM